jgi:acyl-CoA synthetase (AMP-forming)/AMP-acid ligase II
MDIMDIEALTRSAAIPPTEKNSARRSTAGCQTLVEILRMRAELRSDDTAYVFVKDGVDDASQWSYRQLWGRASAIARRLLDLEAEGKRALLLYEPSLDYIAGFLGALQAGAIAVPSYPPSGSRASGRLQSIIDDARPDFILSTTAIRESEEHFRAEFWRAQALSWITTETLTPETLEEAKGAYRPAGPKAIALLQYTSGSTGNPKGVMVTHRNLMSNAEALCDWLGRDPEPRGCIWLPPFHDMGLMGGILQPLYQGFPVVLFSPRHFIQQPIRWLRAISRHRSTVTSAPNFAFDLCINDVEDEDLAGIDLSSLRVAFCGAEPVRKETLMRFFERFAPFGLREEALTPCYGMAETTLIVSGKPPGATPVFRHFDQAALDERRVVERDAASPGARPLSSCGPVVRGLAVEIVDPQSLKPSLPGQIGEIWVAGEHVAAGYWRREAETREAFGAEVAGDGRRYLRTGDLGFLLDGELFIAGRIKDLIIIAGRNHYPQDIELTAEAAHPAISANGVAAFAIEREGEEALVLVAEARRTRKAEAQEEYEEIRRTMLQAVVSGHGVAPVDIYLAPGGTIPRTTSGKIQRQACKRAYLGGTLRRRLDERGSVGSRSRSMRIATE